MDDMGRRVVVTGVGLVSPTGIGTEAAWSAILAGTSGIGPVTLFDAAGFPCRIAGEVSGFDPLCFVEKRISKKPRAPGSGCSVQFGAGRTTAAPGSAQGLGLIVSDLQIALDEFSTAGIAVDEVYHFGATGKAGGGSWTEWTDNQRLRI